MTTSTSIHPDYITGTWKLDPSHSEVSFTVTLKEPLHAFEHWEKLEGNWYVVRVDPTTSEKLVVFRSPPTVKYFEAAVDPQTAEVAVMLDRDPLSFREEELMREPGP